MLRSTTALVLALISATATAGTISVPSYGYWYRPDLAVDEWNEVKGYKFSVVDGTPFELVNMTVLYGELGVAVSKFTEGLTVADYSIELLGFVPGSMSGIRSALVTYDGGSKQEVFLVTRFADPSSIHIPEPSSLGMVTMAFGLIGLRRFARYACLDYSPSAN